MLAGLLVGDHTSHSTHRAMQVAARDPKLALSGASARRASAPTAAELATARENAAINRLLARQPFISAGGSERREVALTFDDGPGPYTPQLLSQLQRLHAPATFFEIGFMFRWFHSSATREVQMGDVIGDHTESHPVMARLSRKAQERQILGQTQWLRRYQAAFPRLCAHPTAPMTRRRSRYCASTTC